MLIENIEIIDGKEYKVIKYCHNNCMFCSKYQNWNNCPEYRWREKIIENANFKEFGMPFNPATFYEDISRD